MRHAIALALIAAILIPAAAVARQDVPVYSLIRVDITPPADDAALLSNPNLDIAAHKPGSYMDIVAQPRDVEWLRSVGAVFDVVQPDMAAHYAAQYDEKGANFGIFHSYSEITDWLDLLNTTYPNVVSAKWSLGLSGEGRDLWCVRVSDNPEIDEGEPEILFDGMHHAREIMASETPMMLIEHLASNYGFDPAITWLLDNREIYVVPVVNPDGFVYNETTDPAGGGMWRKNRRNNGGGSYGVDPNRNYPYEWVGPGSSTDPWSETYRGPSAGSEPEVQAMMALVNAHAFVTSQSFHSYSNLTLYPWGHTLTPSPDASIFIAMAAIMTRENGYAPGTAPELLYEVNGGSFDWVYGAQTEHAKCYAFSNEIGGGGDGFWPLESRRETLFQENLWPSLYQIMAAGAYVEAHTPMVVGGDGNGSLNAGETAGLSFTLENLGVGAAVSALDVVLTCDDPYLTFVENARSLGGLGVMGSQDLAAAPFMVEIDAALPASRAIKVTVTVTADGVVTTYGLTYPAGSSSILFSDNFDMSTAQWAMTGTWGSTGAQYHSPSSSLTDSPSGSYLDETQTSATTVAPITLPGGGELTFWHKYDIENNWDYGYVRVSTDGASWSTLATYTGTSTTWSKQTVDLGAFSGQNIYLRFELETDYSVTRDGWYVDDVIITGSGSLNGLPPAPALISPLVIAAVGATPELVVAESVDPEGDPVTYGFRVYADAELTQLVASASGIAASGGQAAWTVSPALTDGDYWWRAFAADTIEWGLMGEVGSFTVTTTTGVGVAVGGFDLRVISATGGRGAELMLQMPSAGDLRVDVYNARGQIVRTLASESVSRGAYPLSWDGCDATGRIAASGIYFVRAQTGKTLATRRVLMIR